MSGIDEGISAAWTGNGTETSRQLSAFSQRGATWLTLLVVLAGLVTLALLSGALIVLAQGRRARTEVARLESAALLLASAVQRGSAEDGDTKEIVAAVRETLEHRTRDKLFDLHGTRLGARFHH